jgi:multisubunit Na+/H+ antiporter MnhG subunit
MLIRNLGTILLGLGFVMLASAALIRDPTALDANIGAGVLTLVGIPVGTLGLALTVTHAVYRAWHRRRGDRSRRR